MLAFLKDKLGTNPQVENAKEATENLEWTEIAFDLIRNIRDPEKAETLEQLDVVKEDLVEVRQGSKPGLFVLKITFVPTVPHCSLATLIGLCIRTKLQSDLPSGRFKIDLAIKVNKPTINYHHSLES